MAGAAAAAAVVTGIITLSHFVTLCTTKHHTHHFLRSFWGPGTVQVLIILTKLFVSALVGLTRRSCPLENHGEAPFNPWKSTSLCQNFHTWLDFLPVPAGYGFVDFDSPASAQKAVTALKAGGVQAQMAKVRTARNTA